MHSSRSPLFYVGDKYKLMSQLIDLFPKGINNFYEPFLGGGTVFLNVEAKNYFLNDIDKNLVRIHKFLIQSSKDQNSFFQEVQKIICEFGLSRSFQEDIIPNNLKMEFRKTYFARFNKVGYEKLREFVNTGDKSNPLLLYILLIYGFNRMLRFNSKGEFNVPVGNVDFNKNVVNALKNYFSFVKDKKILLSSEDFRTFLTQQKYRENDFVYIDPPYLITGSEYNKLWNDQLEQDLLETIDKLNQKSIRFALSNVTHYNGDKNDILIKWSQKYNSHSIASNYISYHNNKKKRINEVLITNY